IRLLPRRRGQMVTPKNYGTFVFVGFCAWRIIACSTNAGPGGTAGFGTGGSSFGAGGGGGAGAQHPLGGAAGVPSAGNTGGAFLNVGQGAASGANSREMDSSCHPIKEVPEKVV